MKSAIITILLTFCTSVLGADVAIHVVDETGASVADADTAIIFVAPRQGQSVVYRGKSDQDGGFSAGGEAVLWVYIEAKKDGYYGARIDNLPRGKNLDQRLVLPRVLKPTALYANRSYAAGGNHTLKFPAQNQWFSYDFEASDWVQPYGKGKTPDILFQFRNTYRGYLDGIQNLDEEIAFSKRAFAARHEEWTEEKFKMRTGKWDAELKVSFPGDEEGMHEVKDLFLPYSEMKLPHEAPPNGYVPTWSYAINNYTPTTIRDNVGFFLRTRVNLDRNGRIMSANYSKIVGDLRPDVQGMLEFTYYFNPVPNDRNLEFDPKRNLFPKDFPGANVSDP
jgi:hypothetical protein